MAEARIIVRQRGRRETAFLKMAICVSEMGGFFMKGTKKRTVILADRDGFYLQRLKRCLERKGEWEVLGMTESGPAVLELAKQLRPDVILMDILLSDRDGFWVLEHLQKEEIDCISILISAIDSDKLVRRAINLGAEYYMAKPIQGELLMERIYQLLEEEPQKTAEQPMPTETEDTAAAPRNLEGEISVLLSRMGISASIKGYHFIRKAVLLAVEDQEILVGITKGLYPDIAREYKTTASKVERAIRHAIESAWKKNGPQVYFEAAGYLPSEKPTNGQFIAAISEFLRIHKEELPQKIS